MELTLHAFELPLRHEFRISRGARSSQRTLIVELEFDGNRGYGEATESGFYQVTLPGLVAAIESVRTFLQDSTPEQPARLWEELAARLGSHPFALCAVDEAVWDLHGKCRGLPLYQLWGQSLQHVPASDYTLGIDDVDVMVGKLREMPDWPIYKIKLGTSHDLQIVRELRKHTSATFRVDANCGWSLPQALELIPALAELGVEFVEQPLPQGQWQEQARLFSESKLPLIADESCQIPSDVAKCERHFHGINIKLVKCGGITPARKMIEDARSRQMSVMVGCMTESTVGISSIAQLLPSLDYVDMDGAVLLAADIATGASLDRGICRFPHEAGCGIALRPDADQYRIPLEEMKDN